MIFKPSCVVLFLYAGTTTTMCFHIKNVHVHNEVYLVVVPRRGV